MLHTEKHGYAVFEFDYANEEPFYCRPLRIKEIDGKVKEQMPVAEEASDLSMAFLPQCLDLLQTKSD